MFRVILVVFLLLLLGMRVWYYYRDMPVYKNGDRARFAATLLTEPEVQGGRQRFVLRDEKGIKISILNGGVLPYHYGDRLFIDGLFTVRQGRYFIYYPDVQILKSEHNFLSQLDTFIKTQSISLLNSSIPPISSSFLMGMIFGGRQSLPAEFLDKLRITGVIHVIAASGMNVTLVAAALVSIFGRLMRRQYVLVLSIAGIIFYAFLAGFEPSITRAMVMAIIAFGAALLGKQYIALMSLIFTGYMMLLFYPMNLFDIGFQLSFLSTLGIIQIKPLFPFQKYFLVEDVGTTIAAQLATLPVLLNTFGQYGVLSILVNAFVLWTIPYLMIFGSLAVSAGLIFVPLGKLFAWLCLPFLLYFEKVVSFFANPGWVFEFATFPTEFTIAYYLILAAIILTIKKIKDQRSKIKK